jgi:hypothetical protein
MTYRLPGADGGSAERNNLDPVASEIPNSAGPPSPSALTPGLVVVVDKAEKVHDPMGVEQ